MTEVHVFHIESAVEEIEECLLKWLILMQRIINECELDDLENKLTVEFCGWVPRGEREGSDRECEELRGTANSRFMYVKVPLIDKKNKREVGGIYLVKFPWYTTYDGKILYKGEKYKLPERLALSILEGLGIPKDKIKEIPPYD